MNVDALDFLEIVASHVGSHGDAMTTEKKKEKKPRGPRKTALQHNWRQTATDTPSSARTRSGSSALRSPQRNNAQAAYDAADAAFKAMDEAVQTQKQAPASGETAARGRV